MVVERCRADAVGGLRELGEEAGRAVRVDLGQCPKDLLPRRPREPIDHAYPCERAPDAEGLVEKRFATVLDIAAALGSLECTKFAIEAGVRVDVDTARQALAGGNRAVFEELWRRLDIDTRRTSPFGLLRLARNCGNSAVQAFLKRELGRAAVDDGALPGIVRSCAVDAAGDLEGIGEPIKALRVDCTSCARDMLPRRPHERVEGWRRERDATVLEIAAGMGSPACVSFAIRAGLEPDVEVACQAVAGGNGAAFDEIWGHFEAAARGPSAC